ncbi:ab22894b-c20b-47f2-86bc-c1fedd4baa19 [Sclerotinia trifoliorum]|uniref:Ab22894b-c20b-47f2-86bc-c1fedd4baa19 n=1 Tax=Sclerotinia trifoliorum TaxID=28548 RepID=A0A8H2W460_9HELO|nr:ab22894b-c20b-47f2-86bc-c1fedd4baa19 [Sclerotinia trifoliorum]
MSAPRGSGGGYYKYRCKYWLVYNCGNWVWVNNEPCANCLAIGREETVISRSQYQMSRDVFVPQFKDGNLHYTMTEIITLSDFDNGWVVKETQSAEFPKSTSPTIEKLEATEGATVQIFKEPVAPRHKEG